MHRMHQSWTPMPSSSAATGGASLSLSGGGDWNEQAASGVFLHAAAPSLLARGSRDGGGGSTPSLTFGSISRIGILIQGGF
jgi:hypothetical protein